MRTAVSSGIPYLFADQSHAGLLEPAFEILIARVSHKPAIVFERESDRVATLVHYPKELIGLKAQLLGSQAFSGIPSTKFDFLVFVGGREFLGRHANVESPSIAVLAGPGRVLGNFAYTVVAKDYSSAGGFQLFLGIRMPT